MKRIFFPILLLFLPILMYAQEFRWEDFMDDFIENQSAEGDEEQEMEERLYEMHLNPININDCSREQLIQIPFVGEAEADSILHYIKENGPIYSQGELFLACNMDYYSRQVLTLFVQFGNPPKDNSKNSFFYQMAHARQEVAGTFNMPFQKMQGYKSTINKRTGEVKKPRYLGEPYSGTLRYRMNYSNKLMLGITASQNDGEPFAKSINPLFDAYSFYLSHRTNGILQHWLIGDYKIHIGKGLTSGAGYLNTGKGLLNSRHDHSQGIFAHSGTSEYGYLRGGAAQLAYKHLSVLLFASARKVDGRIQGDSVFSLITTGYHRLPIERERKNNILNTSAGISIDWKHGPYYAGISSIYSHYNHQFVREENNYKRYNLIGKNFLNTGIHYGYSRQTYDIGGEISVSELGSFASLHDMRFQLSPFTRTFFQHRYYSRAYQAPLARAYAGSGGMRGEHGIMAGVMWQPSQKWNLIGSADIFRLLGTTYRALESANGYKINTEIVFSPYRITQWSLRYDLRSQQESSSSHPVLSYYMKHTMRLQNKISLGKFDFTTSLLGDCFTPAYGDKEYGWLFSERINTSIAGFKISGDAVIFHTDSYKSALYSYLPALLYARSYSNFYYHGYATSIILERMIGSYLDIGCKLTAIHYTNRTSIGTAERSISGSNKGDFTLQIRWFF